VIDMPGINPSPATIAGAGARSSSAASKRKRDKEILESAPAQELDAMGGPNREEEQIAPPWTLRRAFQEIFSKREWDPKTGKYRY
jgi:hypothetical protein